MKKQFLHQKIFLFALFITTVLSSHAQQKITIISTKENNYCNSTCTLLNIPELNNNPEAIIFVTAVAKVPHPMAAYYIQTKRDTAQWSILNLDNTQVQVGTQFSVEYYVQPDTIHFLHVISQQNLKNNGSYIDHAGLNDNPNAQFNFFQNLAPIARGGIANNYDLKIQYDTVVHRWYMFNTNNRQLSYGDGYNIAILSGGNSDTIPVIGNAGIVNKVEPRLVPGKTVPTSYDFSKIRICIDKINTNPLPPRPPVNNAAALPKINPNGDLETVSIIRQGLTSVTDQMWSPGDVITVGFFPNEASASVMDKVKQYAKSWENYANIQFEFVDNVKNALVKVGFIQNGTSWSWVGRDVLSNTFNINRTMNFGWFDDTTPDTLIRKTTLHEFGHVLGFVHEHQSPTVSIPWDVAKVYAYFEGDPNFWSKETIDHNIFEKYSQTNTNFSSYDPHSIMHYWFPQELLTDGSSSSFSFTFNTNFSATDTTFTKLLYPFPPSPTNATGVLRTGDNCDEIVFLVEYNVVDKNSIEFILEPGINQYNNLIKAWKKIGIPLIGGSEAALEIQNGSTKIGTIPISLIDKTRGISFGKTNLIGENINLNYKWNALPAIIGGCRVRLTWRKDKCI